jgi:hypothetical protein
MKINAVDRGLCDKLYAKYGWEPDAWWAKSSYSGGWVVVPSKYYKAPEYHDEPGAGNFYGHTPAYDLDFLIDKVPYRNGDIQDTFLLGRNENNKGWAVAYKENVYTDEVARNAVAKFLLDLPHYLAEDSV